MPWLPSGHLPCRIVTIPHGAPVTRPRPLTQTVTRHRGQRGQAYPGTVLTTGVLGKIGVVGRVGVLAGVAGLLVGGLAVPAVGATGLIVRNGANKFNNLKAARSASCRSAREILDSQGHLIAYYYPRGIDRQPVSYNQISPVMRNAIVAIEDSRFYQHGAIDIKGTVRALINDLQHKAVQGGSTLDPAVREERPHPDRAEHPDGPAGLDRHAQPQDQGTAAGHRGREQDDQEPDPGRLPEHGVLGHLLRQPGVGHQDRRDALLQHLAEELDLAQSALLAGMVENPVADDPFAHPETALNRRNVVLARMAQLHYITEAHAVAVGKQGLGLKLTPLQTGCTSGSAKSASFFCDYVISLMKQDSTFSTGLESAERRRRAEGVHHAEPAGRARGQAGGELHGAAAAERVQPGRQRRGRGADPAGQRAHPGHRQRPLLRHREEPDHRGLRGELAVRRRRSGCRPVRPPSCSRCSPRWSRACRSASRRR